MKKITYYSCAFLIWMFTCLPSALAAEFYLIDSDNDVYHVGHYLGSFANHESYNVDFYPADSPRTPTGQGILYYDSVHQSVKILIFENNQTYGLTLEGHWTGSGSSVSYANSDLETGQLGLYFRDSSRRARSKNKRIKNIKKDQTE
ncbi:MAG: hypothetical protein KAH20_03950 [Methylococcales bacterium]|nr:hypothetical protein [Methylococcales bacterium]